MEKAPKLELSVEEQEMQRLMEVFKEWAFNGKHNWTEKRIPVFNGSGTENLKVRLSADIMEDPHGRMFRVVDAVFDENGRNILNGEVSRLAELTDKGWSFNNDWV